MKKISVFFAIAAIVCCAFALSVSAEESVPEVTHTYYVVASNDSATALALKAEGKETVVLSEIYSSTVTLSDTDWIAQFAQGSHIELVFAENVVEKVDTDTGILLNKEITLTVNYNGFCHFVTNNGRSNVFVLRHADSSIRFFGTKAIDGEDGSISHDFNYTGVPETSSVDIFHGKVYCWIYDGDAYAENMRTRTNEEFIFVTGDDNTEDSKINTYELVDCAVSFLGLNGQGNSAKIIKAYNSYFNKFQIYTICNGSVIENCTFGTEGIYMDCHDITKQMLTVKNSVVPKITTYTGRTHFTLIDCDVDTSKISLGSDGGGDGFAMIFTSASCENPGAYELVRNNSKRTAFPWQDTVDQFWASNSAPLGHDISWSFDFEGDKYLSACTATNGCARCKSVIATESFGAMLSTLGYSVPEYNGCYAITIGLSINRSAIEKYEALAQSHLSYGIAIAVKDALGQGVAPLDESGNALTLESGNVIKIEALGSLPLSFCQPKVILAENRLDTMLLMTCYVLEEKDGSTTVSYMQGNSLIEASSFTYISYNCH